MITYQIKTDSWQSRLNKVSRRLEDRKLNLEVIGKDVGSQIEAKSVVLKGLAYDPKSDIVEISSENFEHFILEPRAIFFTEELESLKSIEFVDSKERRQIVTFTDQLLLE